VKWDVPEIGENKRSGKGRTTEAHEREESRTMLESRKRGINRLTSGMKDGSRKPQEVQSAGNAEYRIRKAANGDSAKILKGLECLRYRNG